MKKPDRSCGRAHEEAPDANMAAANAKTTSVWMREFMPTSLKRVHRELITESAPRQHVKSAAPSWGRGAAQARRMRACLCLLGMRG
jgi:hypothetical protein